MIEAWLSASEMIASSSPSRGSNRPPLASKQAAYRIVSSVPKNAAILASSCLCRSCVPQMKRTLAMPKPWLSRASLAAWITRGWSARPR